MCARGRTRARTHAHATRGAHSHTHTSSWTSSSCAQGGATRRSGGFLGIGSDARAPPLTTAGLRAVEDGGAGAYVRALQRADAAELGVAARLSVEPAAAAALPERKLYIYADFEGPTRLLRFSSTDDPERVKRLKQSKRRGGRKRRQKASRRASMERTQLDLQVTVTLSSFTVSVVDAVPQELVLLAAEDFNITFSQDPRLMTLVRALLRLLLQLLMMLCVRMGVSLTRLSRAALRVVVFACVFGRYRV